jgi:hypothetical protein
MSRSDICFFVTGLFVQCVAGVLRFTDKASVFVAYAGEDGTHFLTS